MSAVCLGIWKIKIASFKELMVSVLRDWQLKQNRNCSHLYTKKHSKENLYDKMILVVYNENSTDLVAVICIYNGLLAFCQLYILEPL